MKGRALIFFGLLASLGMGGESARDFEVTYEVFSLPLAKAASLRRADLGDAALHQRLRNLSGKGLAKPERWMNLRVREGESGLVREGEEFPYRAEWEPDSFSPRPGGLGGFRRFPKAPPIPVSSWWAPILFYTKTLGDELSCEVSENGGALSLDLLLRHVSLVGLDQLGEGVSSWKMPRFSVQSLRISVPVGASAPVLLGTISPPDQAGDVEEKRVWLAFVTIEQI